jgi:hypothetical protein
MGNKRKTPKGAGEDPAFGMLIEFLNLPDACVVLTEKNHFKNINHAWLYYNLPDNPQAAVALQAELRESIFKLLPGADAPEKSLLEVLANIEKKKMGTAYRKILTVEEARKGHEPFSLIELARRPLALIEGGNPEENLWRILDRALRSGTFSRAARYCRQCGMFFAAQDPRDVYCSSRCQYERRTQENPGYFANRMKESRARAKEKRKAAERQKARAMIRLRNPETWLKRMITVSKKQDASIKTLALYKRLGGPLAGRRFFSKLAGKQWKHIDATARATIARLAEDFPL